MDPLPGADGPLSVVGALLGQGQRAQQPDVARALLDRAPVGPHRLVGQVVGRVRLGEQSPCGGLVVVDLEDPSPRLPGRLHVSHQGVLLTEADEVRLVADLLADQALVSLQRAGVFAEAGVRLGQGLGHPGIAAVLAGDGVEHLERLGGLLPPVQQVREFDVIPSLAWKGGDQPLVLSDDVIDAPQALEEPNQGQANGGIALSAGHRLAIRRDGGVLAAHLLVELGEGEPFVEAPASPRPLELVEQAPEIVASAMDLDEPFAQLPDIPVLSGDQGQGSSVGLLRLPVLVQLDEQRSDPLQGVDLLAPVAGGGLEDGPPLAQRQVEGAVAGIQARDLGTQEGVVRALSLEPIQVRRRLR